MKWQYKVSFKSFYRDESVPIAEKGKLVASALRRKLPASLFDWQSDDYDEEIDEIVNFFDEVTGFDDVSPVEEFDMRMEALYDWADAGKTLWIET